LETQIIIAEKVGYIQNGENLRSDITIVRKMLNALISSLKKGISNPHEFNLRSVSTMYYNYAPSTNRYSLYSGMRSERLRTRTYTKVERRNESKLMADG